MVVKSRKRNGRGGYRERAGRKPTLRDPITLTVRIDGDDFDMLVALADADGIGFSDYIRRLLKRHIASRRAKH